MASRIEQDWCPPMSSSRKPTENSEVLSKGRIPENPVQQVGYVAAGSRCGVALLAAACSKAVLRVSAGVRVLNGNP